MRTIYRPQLFFASLAIFSGITIGMASTKTVNVKKPGTLERQIKAKDASKLTALKINGTLNNDDIRFLRLLLGRDSLNNPVPTSLRELDMENVIFSTEGAPYAGKKYRITSPTTLPAVLTYGTQLEKFVLPASVDSIAEFSLSSCGLTDLDLSGMKYVHSTALNGDTLLQRLRLPALEEVISPTYAGLKGLRSITYGDLDYCHGQAFNDLPDLEEIIFDGMVGHIDGYTISNCPKLKRVEFRGPINTTGGALFTQKCPELEEISIDGLAIYFGNVENKEAPKLKG